LPPALRAAQDRPAYTASVVQVAALDGRASKFGVDDVEVQDELRLLVGELQRRARTRPVRDDEMRSHPVQDDVTKGGEFARVVRTPPRHLGNLSRLPAGQDSQVRVPALRLGPLGALGILLVGV